jgi:hypothetical protein
VAPPRGEEGVTRTTVEGREPLAKESVGAFTAPDVSRPPLTALGQGCLRRLHDLMDGLFARLYGAPEKPEKRARNRDRVMGAAWAI